ncbi:MULTISPECIES: DNA topoisomerase IV subunit A [Thalassospira]|jgi:topoisomerase-4 subunit A|uniref:DNA topoisomerase 4 subunit A n=2 Tax=Thalassospira tepidiphila TaxID=393657 RepID=A0A853KXY2_9PROT|nr:MULTISPECIES: DNA topoisomerase IV subunit A [Thalassospira]EKF07568.1 DNA topoisomerase IV subunit A [Thalassospira profundimaris WP0211]MBO6580566.1 DNA topoisomerase IV subunit A [Thalassospira sp.]MBO6803223.1 DNA topoisomerase IV subunit A [Thalassospira sp.]MBO6888727.1 DNA topoisomerase IV subunit A [Thalassospira sp.]NJB75484.1 topoisomerase-4 subunit A [Thalassospira tepidiphila]
MSTKTSDPASAGQIRETRLADALSERYLAYAMSTIMSRSLPDVRDGLKPVHRRLLYAMRQLKLNPEQGFKKCARVVGDVIGKYHPHGDQSVYDALVRLAQDFAVRYPLVDGQGNFGNIDGDNAAAMRYTEARMTAVAAALMDGLDEDAVDFRPTYDGEEKEPVVMPAAFPNLLANGASGIAVGMATNIPPHNAGELCTALIKLIDDPETSIAQLVRCVPGPDFPTGGVLVEPRENILEAYATGRGSFRLRAKWEVEKLSHGLYQVVITEIPYQVQKAKLVERIADLMVAKKLPLLNDVRDESTDIIRLVLEPRTRAVEPEHLMEMLFKNTELEIRFGLNMNVLDGDNTPRVMNLREVLRAFLAHRQDVLIRRSNHRLAKINHRLEVLEGYLVAYLNLDEVIRIIRYEDEPKNALMKAFDLTEVQADAILNMRLRSLRKLEEMEIKNEHAKLTEEKQGLEALLASESLRWEKIRDEIEVMRENFGKKTAIGKRRTEIGDAPEEIEVPLEALIEREPITVICSKMGWVRALKGHVADISDLKFKDGDEHRFALKAFTTDKLLILSTAGRCYTMSCDKLPGGRGHGEPIRLSIDLPQEHDIVSMVVHKEGRNLLVASSGGRGFLVAEKEVVAQTKNGKQVLNLGTGEVAKIFLPVEQDHVAVLGDNRKLLIYPVSEIPEMTRGRGVILQKYRQGGLSDLILFNLEEGLSWTMGGSEGRTRTVTELAEWIGKRAGAGRLPPNGFPRSNKFE